MNANDRGIAAAPAAARHVPTMNIANVLTVLRLVMVPVFIWLMLQPGDVVRLAAAVVFMVAAATDRLDGQVARSRNLVTNFGKIADPIADKALTLSAFIMLSVDNRLWWWVTIIIVVRELGITIMRFFMLRRAVMAASRGGKIKTTLQMLSLGGLILPWTLFLPSGLAYVLTMLSYGVAAAALVVTVVTGLDYVEQARRIVSNDRSGEDA